jgi:hypothetical protein
MAATPQDVQSKLASALNELEHVTSSPAKIVAQYGTNPAKWPTGHLKNTATLIQQASAEAGQLTVKKLTAAFKESS